MRTKYTRRADGSIEYAPTYKGKRKHFYGHSDAEIDAKVREWKAAIDSNRGRTFEAVAQEYWKEKEPTLSINSYNNYRIALRTASEYFEGTPIEEITPQLVLQYLKKFQAQGLSAKVIANRKIVLKGVLDHAMITGEISSNPCVGLPLVKGRQKVMREPASDEDIKKIESAKTDSMMGRLYYFMLYSGLRLGEACALQQKDVDRKAMTISVNKSLAYGGQALPTLKCPKTEAGKRTVVLLKNAAAVLPKGKPDDYIFFPEGFPTKGTLESAQRIYRRTNDIKATPHQLRHSFASLLHSAGIDVKDAADILGHSDTHLTQNLYTHLEKIQRKAVNDRLDAFVSENRLK